jgi:glycosyltransferase involved in cell wall biosynthesis
VTRDYLLSNGFCAPEDVTFIYGGVFPAGRLASDQPARRRFPRDKETLDICFVAYKYMERGRDKGYDVFVETARNLARRAPEARFHVVGSFGPGDVDASDIRDRMTFHGPRTTGFFPEFYSGMDLVLSPNAPHILSPGAFDGFPTGACIEAGLCGTAVFACDELGLNPFVDGEEIVVVPRDPARIADTVMAYRDDPARLERVGRGGQERFREAFSEENQMEPRIRVVEELLASGRGEAG